MASVIRGGARNWIAEHLLVTEPRKEQLYLDLSQSATVRDATFWLQILFAAGIATLGLALNSAAVIIGAMLISPLMGPILAGGLSLASGDVVLGLRSAANLVLSCLVAVVFSLLLVFLLPFKEMTAEIAARTQPNTLDLVIALFSGAVGSFSTCKEVKGVATSIPGVAIAVALMPPLCVVGYGLGLAASLNADEGMRVARGGGLLFLTNLFAITLMATLVFVALQIDTGRVRERVREWQQTDRESEWVRAVLGKLHTPEGTRTIGSLPGRLLVILVPLILILGPLSQSLNQLSQEIRRRQQENRISRITRELWQQKFARLESGEPRSFIDQLNVSETADKLGLFVRVLTSRPITPEERTAWIQSLASRLGRSADTIDPQLVEIPLTSSEILAKTSEDRRDETPPTVAELHGRFVQSVGRALAGLRLPPPAALIDYSLESSPVGPFEVSISYLGERDISEDAHSLIGDDVRRRFSAGEMRVTLHRIPSSMDPILFGRNRANLPASCTPILDETVRLLVRHRSLRLQIVSTAEVSEREQIAEERAQALMLRLAMKSQEVLNRVAITSAIGAERSVVLKLQLPPPEGG